MGSISLIPTDVDGGFLGHVIHDESVRRIVHAQGCQDQQQLEAASSIADGCLAAYVYEERFNAWLSNLQSHNKHAMTSKLDEWDDKLALKTR